MPTQPSSEPPNDEPESGDTKNTPAARPQVVRPRERATGRREFWLALAGIVATFVTGVVVQSFTYDSNRKLNAEQFRTTERKAAYGNLIGKTSALDDAELHARVGVPVALGLAPLVVYEKWKAIGWPPIVERTRENAQRREAERRAKCEAKRHEKQRVTAAVRSGADESSR